MDIHTSNNNRKRFLIIFSISVLFVLLFSLQQQLKIVSQRPAVQKQTTAQSTPGLPIRLMIPAIDVDSTIEHVGVTSEGNMDVPGNISDVGWFNLGSRPGEKGSAVISGHVNGPNGEPGVFANLSTLKKDDTILIKDDKGTAFTFVVRKIRSYNQGYAEEVFSANDTTRLNLVTCSGVWDTKNQNYTSRLVVFTELTQAQ